MEVAEIQAAWPDIKGGSYPLGLGEFVAQVPASAPDGSVAKGKLKSLSSRLGASGDPLQVRAQCSSLLGVKKQPGTLQTLRPLRASEGSARTVAEVARRWLRGRNQRRTRRFSFAGAAVFSNSAHGFAFFGFSADDKDLSNIYLKFNEDGSDDDLKNEWDPAKYACLSYVDWDIAPIDKTVTPSKRAAKAVSKEKKV